MKCSYQEIVFSLAHILLYDSHLCQYAVIAIEGEHV
jgi:hypothetical protein